MQIYSFHFGYWCSTTNPSPPPSLPSYFTGNSLKTTQRYLAGADGRKGPRPHLKEQGGIYSQSLGTAVLEHAILPPRHGPRRSFCGSHSHDTVDALRLTVDLSLLSENILQPIIFLAFTMDLLHFTGFLGCHLFVRSTQ